MAIKTKRVFKRNNTTRKNYFKNNSQLTKLQKQITIIFFEFLLMVKMFHWNTHSFSTHKATDEIYSSLNENMDKFMEVLLGKSGKRINIENGRNIKLEILFSNGELKQRIESFKKYLVQLDDYLTSQNMTNSDLLNIRDEILGDMNKFLYLLTLN